MNYWNFNIKSRIFFVFLENVLKCTWSLLLANSVGWKHRNKVKSWCSSSISDWGVLQLWRASPIILAFSAVRLFVKYVHQLESVAVRQSWCERICESICWHSGQRYVINADFTLHWIELALIATSPPLIHPIKPSLFIYLQPQPPDMHGMSALTAHKHAPAKVNCAHISSPFSSKAVKDAHHYHIIQAVSWQIFLTWNKILSFYNKCTSAHVLRHTQSLCIVLQCTGKELNSIRLWAGQP